MLFLFPLERRETCSFLVRTRKERKEAASLRLDRSCGRQRFDGGYERRRPRSRGSRDPSIAAVFADIIPECAHAARALRLRAQTSQRHILPARRVVACASFASTATPLEPWVCASQQKVESPRRSLGKSFGTFLFTEKSTYPLLWKGEKHVLFFAERKERKEAANVPFDRLCGRQRFGGGYERRRPRSRISRDPSTAAIFVDIAPGSAHTARALRLRAQAFQTHRASARRMVACASSASTATPFEPCVYASQQKHESPRRKSRRLFSSFSRR